MQRISLLLLFIIFLAIGAAAQRSSEIGLSGGGSYYIGELNPGKPFVNTKPAFGIFYRKNLNSRIALQLHAFHGSLSGDGKSAIFAQDSSLNFVTKVNELAAQVEVNFFDFYIGSRKDKLSPYVFGGVGVFMFKPKDLNNGTELRTLNTEGQGPAGGSSTYKLTQLCFPFGLGLKYSPGPYIGLGMEWGMRKTTTDYIDDISTTYPLTSPLYPGMQRGNAENNDWYSFAMISIAFKFRMLEKANCLDQDKYRSPNNKSARN